jgi:type I restriction-modification system DNA methylase subunit
MQTKEEAYYKINSLVQRFAEQRDFYKHRDYNETQTRRDFIDPFWKSLGWDIDNENGYAESYREVIHEDRVKVGGATKTPDYSFRLSGGKRLFFLEAKKPSVTLKEDINPAYQIRRYGWSAKMPISVITNFEEFAVYDCLNKPKPTDKASNGRIKYLTYNNYDNEFEFIWDVFSKEKVLKGSFDRFVQSDTNKKGTTTVDSDFLNSLDKWRLELARNIALRNRKITEDELNFAVQLLLDRIVFLRIAEDRNAERYGDLKEAVAKGDTYPNILQRFRVAEQKYNSGLFDFKKDKITDKIVIDNKIIKNIITELYYPESPYEFSVLSVEILGSAYEQFLGKQIALSRSGRATIEEKPEVRKAGGVYYTPQYIVDYIVKNTVGKLIISPAPSKGVEITPKEVSELKICDPACGSGSFLIGAYQYLLTWHKDYYTQNGKQSKGSKNCPLTPSGELTTAEKKRILLNNIYGVDIDSNAVEVTKLSLLLKCMEGETKETVETQTRIFHDRILPSLDNNIKSGNSLIDLDYYENRLDFGEERKIKPFSWQLNFPEVFENGGFDCVIGNPPYGADIDNLVKYFEKKYPKTSCGFKDIYKYFFEKATYLLNNSGNMGFITPNTFLRQPRYGDLRRLLLDYGILQLIDLGENVFETVVVPTAITVISKKKTENVHFADLTKEKKLQPAMQTIDFDIIKQESYLQSANNIFVRNVRLKRENEFLLDEILEMKDAGINYQRVNVGLRDKGNSDLSKRLLYEGEKQNMDDVEFWKGTDINSYFIENQTNRYCKQNIQLGKNERVILNKKYFEIKPKLIWRQTAPFPITAIDYKGIWFGRSIQAGIIKNDFRDKVSYEYLCGLLNSKYIRYLYEQNVKEGGRVFPQVKLEKLKCLPVILADSIKQEETVKSVFQLLRLNKELQNTTLAEKAEQIKHKITYFENKIDEITFKLYELTEDEIKVVKQIKN